VLLRRRAGRGRLTTLDLVYFPIKPTLHGAYAYANALAFGHPFGADTESWKPPRRVHTVKVGRAPSGERVAAVQLVVSPGPSARMPSLKASSAARWVRSEILWVASAAWRVTGSVLLYAEVRGIPLALGDVERLPWPALAQGEEGIYAPGFMAYLEAWRAEREKRGKLILSDWKPWEPQTPEEREPTPRRMLMLLAKPPPEEGGDGRVIYALWLAPSVLGA